MAITITPMNDDDLPAVLALWSVTEGMGLTESDTPEHLRAYLARNPGLSLVVRDGSKIVGAVLCGHDGRRGALHHLAVMPEYRKRGLGTRMVETCLKSMGAIGIVKCHILVYADNELGKQFWRACGWSGRSDLEFLQHECPRLEGN